MKNLGLYIHIPFCLKKCDYCNFSSFCMPVRAQKAYLTALKKEIDLKKAKYKNKSFSSIYIGGGTPSAVFDGFILELSQKIFSSFNIEENAEFTIEVNPKSFNEKKLKEYLLAGVNRVSVGVQCLNEKVVQNVGRQQTRQDIEKAFNLLNNSPIANISADVILGLPNETLRDVSVTLNYLIKHGVKHISTYTLQVEDGTPLSKSVSENRQVLPTDEQTVAQYNKVCATLAKAGFVRYEISNFAKPGFESQHNQKYWHNVEYLGLGLSAHSFSDGTRFWNTSNFDEYILSIQNNILPQKQEVLTADQKRTERIMLSLRTAEGLDLTAFQKEFNENLLKTRQKEIENLLNLGMICLKNCHLAIKEDKFELSNSIILELL